MDLAKIFISKKALAPSGTIPVGHMPPLADCVAQLVFQAEVRSCPFPVTTLPNRGNCSKPEQVVCVCWTELRLLGNGQEPPEGRCSGGGERVYRSVWILQGEAQSWGPGTFGSEKDSESCTAGRGMSNFNQQPICQMGKLRPRERKGVGQRSGVSSFQLPPELLLPELVHLL